MCDELKEEWIKNGDIQVLNQIEDERWVLGECVSKRNLTSHSRALEVLEYGIRRANGIKTKNEFQEKTKWSVISPHISSIPLTATEKKAYVSQLFDYHVRLHLFNSFCPNLEGKEFQKKYFNLIEAPIVGVAIELALICEFQLLELLFEFYEELEDYKLVILSCIPEVAQVSMYAHLLPSKDIMRSEPRENQLLVFPEGIFKELLLFKFNISRQNFSNIKKWYAERIFDMNDKTMDMDNIEYLVSYCKNELKIQEFEWCLSLTKLVKGYLQKSGSDSIELTANVKLYDLRCALREMCEKLTSTNGQILPEIISYFKHLLIPSILLIKKWNENEALFETQILYSDLYKDYISNLVLPIFDLLDLKYLEEFIPVFEDIGSILDSAELESLHEKIVRFIRASWKPNLAKKLLNAIKFDFEKHLQISWTINKVFPTLSKYNIDADLGCISDMYSESSNFAQNTQIYNTLSNIIESFFAKNSTNVLVLIDDLNVLMDLYAKKHPNYVKDNKKLLKSILLYALVKMSPKLVHDLINDKFKKFFSESISKSEVEEIIENAVDYYYNYYQYNSVYLSLLDDITKLLSIVPQYAISVAELEFINTAFKLIFKYKLPAFLDSKEVATPFLIRSRNKAEIIEQLVNFSPKIGFKELFETGKSLFYNEQNFQAEIHTLSILLDYQILNQNVPICAHALKTIVKLCSENLQLALMSEHKAQISASCAKLSVMFKEYDPTLALLASSVLVKSLCTKHWEIRLKGLIASHSSLVIVQ